MSGVITFSNRNYWLVAGWAWRQLLEYAISLAKSDPRVRILEGTLYTQGVDLALLNADEKAMIVDSLTAAARDLLSDYSHDDTTVGQEMRNRLSELIPQLEAETAGSA